MLTCSVGQAQVSAAAEVEVRPVTSLAIQPHYASPEQTGRTRRIIDARSDLYSLGATLYALLAGRPPFEATRLVALLHAHMARTQEGFARFLKDGPEPAHPVAAE